MEANKYVRFDWAAKKILRDKSSFSILEEGRAEATLDNTRKMIAAGVDKNVVISALQLTPEQAYDI